MEILFDERRNSAAIYSAEIIKIQGLPEIDGLYYWVKFHHDDEVRRYHWKKLLHLKVECDGFKIKTPGIMAEIKGKTSVYCFIINQSIKKKIKINKKKYIKTPGNIKLMHSDKPYMCPHCSKTYYTEEGMRRCINIHTNRWNDTIKKPPKQKIPPEMRFKIWETYVGNHLESLCFCCKSKRITPFTSYNAFQAGHILSENEGGKIEIGNLLPICASCNRKMGTTHWDDYVKEKKLYIRVHGDKIPEIHKQAILLIQRVYRNYKAKKIYEPPIKIKRIKIRKKKRKKKKAPLSRTYFCSMMWRKKLIF